jgi:hypothetical protein
MGVTDFSTSLLSKIIDVYRPKSVCELGDQILYTSGSNYGKYADIYYSARGVDKYVCIDLNGGNGAMVVDMGKPFNVETQYDLVTDWGFSEHVGTDGHFDWEAIYNCWESKFDLCKTGGVIVSENPKTQNWPGHSFQYYTEAFYHQLESASGLRMIDIGEVAAMGNMTDGWNIYCVMVKYSDAFPDLETFKTFSLKQS